MRIVNRVLVALLALAVAGAGLLTAAEVLVARTSWPQDPPLVVPYDTWLDHLRPYIWDDTTVRLGSIAAIVAGALLLAAALLGRERRINLTPEQPDVEPSTSPRALARALRNDAGRVEGVISARARIRHRRAKVAATIRIGDPAVTTRLLHESLTDRLEHISLTQPRKLAVKVTSRRPQ